jgi:hypothetical protein
MEAFRYRSYYYGMTGLGGGSQQGDASVVANSLNQLSQAAMKTGDPIVSGILQAGAALANIVSLFGPNPNNTITTGWVNQIEADVMKPNLAAWQALTPAQKTSNQQAAALQIFMLGWNQVVQLCSNIQLGSAGTSCIADRQNGACKWKDASGKCWNWWSGYHDPIANDPAVAANVAAANSAVPGSPILSSVTGAVDSTVSSVSAALGGINPVWIGVGLIAAALLLVSD